VITFEMEKSWIRGRNDSPFHDFRHCDEQLELCNRKAIRRTST
jgi:hypothetical protein